MRETQVAPAELMAAYTEANPRSRAAFDRATRVLPGGVTHEGRHLTPFPPCVTHARGARKWDLDGHEYVDYAMGHGALILGHAHPAVVEAVSHQVARGTHLGASHLLEVEWAERVQALVPGAELVRFTNSGTEATLLALRIARAATGRPKVLKFRGHFHGWHDAVTPGQSPPWESPPPGIAPSVAQETVVVPPDLEVVNATLRGDPQIGAVIIEPSGASWGTIPLPPGFLPGLRTLTASRGVVLIFDEVITGFRWTPGGVQQVSGVTADLVTMAKILAGGLPGGAVSGRRNLLEYVSLANGSGRIHHPGTFNANPLSAAAGIACLDLVRDPALQARCDRMAAEVRSGMNDILARRGVRGVAYGESSVFHLLFDARVTPGDPRSIGKVPEETLKEQRRMPTVSIAMLLEGIYLFALGGFLSTVHTEEDVTRTIGALDGAVRRLQGLLPT
ncbi:MAG TPA: aspartate aminotransferase family protein [bacterium]|nr:aspartate aminotransferase family protein [bacterium]